MKKSEILRNEAAVMLAGAFEQAAHGVEFEFANTADKIIEKIVSAAEAYVWELQDE